MRHTGFTLVELLIVVAILGLLAVVALGVINPAKRQNLAKDSVIKTDIGQIATALQAYYTSAEKGTYPDNLGDLTINKDLKYLPTPPQGAGAAYSYAVDPTGCDEVNTLCTAAVAWGFLFVPGVSGNVWCWQSSTGQAQELAPAACTP